jgi:hypothetical protein
MSPSDYCLRYWYVQVFERILRMEGLLRLAREGTSRSDRNVVRTFAQHLQSIKHNFMSLFPGLGDPSEELDAPTAASLLKHADACFSDIDQMHFHLSFLSSRWSMPESNVFVRALFDPVQSRAAIPRKISIVLSDTYMFEELELASYLSESANSPRVILRSAPTLLLPKLEAGNPLHWGTLVHELGHALSENLRNWLKSETVSAHIEEIVGDKPRSIAENWAEEFFCDFLGLQLLGPAYLLSFVDFLVLPGIKANLLSPTRTHPFARERVNSMATAMKIAGVEVPFTSPLNDEWGDISEFAAELFNHRCRAGKVHLGDKGTAPEIDAREFEERVKRPLLKEFGGSPCNLNAQRLHLLITRLERGVPIGSLPQFQITNSGAEMQDTINRLREKLASEDAPADADISQAIQMLQDGIREEPVSISEIINAGWLFKLGHLYDPMIKRVHALKPKHAEEFAQALSHLDALLRNSIETSYLGALFRPVSLTDGALNYD